MKSTRVRADAAAAPVLRRQSQRMVDLFTRWYVCGYLRKHFHAVRISGELPKNPPADRPLLLYSNHPSWWDPLIAMLLTRSLFRGRRGFGPMDAEALRKYGFMRRLGVYGVEQGNARGAARFLFISKGVLAEPGTMIWVTPEGHFTDVRARPVRLQPGIAHLVRDLHHAVILPVAMEYPFWNESRPEALIRFGTPVDSGPARDRSASDWNSHLELVLSRTMDALSTQAQTRDPRLFRTLLSGQTGVGFFYDSWRRMKAAVKGRRFSAAHEDHSGEKP